MTSHEVEPNSIKTFRTRDESRLLLRFSAYLDHAAQSRIIVATGDDIYNIPYTTRFSRQYRRKQIARMYRVEEYLKKENKHSVVTMLTLTGYQRGLSRATVFSNIRTSLRLFLDRLRKMCRDIQYMWVMEPHRSGYPHVHVAIFGYVPQDVRDRLSRLWAEKYKVGSIAHGINFTMSNAREGIKSVRNYLMKYITKGIGGETRWTPEERLYFATAWDGHYRLISMSRSLSAFISRAVNKIVRTGPKLSIMLTSGQLNIIQQSQELYTFRDIEYLNTHLKSYGATESIGLCCTGNVTDLIQTYTIRTERFIIS